MLLKKINVVIEEIGSDVITEGLLCEKLPF